MLGRVKSLTVSCSVGNVRLVRRELFPKIIKGILGPDNLSDWRTKMGTKETAKIDVLGLALRDYLRGIRNQSFVHRDDGFSDREPIERYFKSFAEWSQVEQRLLTELNGTVLETGCNRGEHLRYLQERGIDAFGIDICPGAIQLAQEAGVKNCLLMDARKLNFERKFDTVLMLYYGFGLGGTIESQKELLRDLHRLTTERGQIIASSIDALKTNTLQHMAYQGFNRQKGKAYGNVTQVTLRLQHQDHFGDWYDLLFVNPDGLAELVLGTGWQVTKAIPEKEGGRAWYYVLDKCPVDPNQDDKKGG